MKTFILGLLLCAAAIASHAQSIINRTGCDIAVTPFCYTIGACTWSPCSPAITVPSGGSVSLPSCGCGPGAIQGYTVCWAGSTGCGSTCVSVSAIAASYPCTYTPTGILPGCMSCVAPTASVTWDASGNLTIN